MEDVGARAGEGMVRYRQGLRFGRPGAGRDAGVEGAVDTAGSHPLFSSYCFPAPSPLNYRCGRKSREASQLCGLVKFLSIFPFFLLPSWLS